MEFRAVPIEPEVGQSVFADRGARPRRLRVVMVAQSPTPYYTAIQNALADLVDLTIIFMGDPEGARGTLWAAFDDPWGASRRFRSISQPSLTITLSSRDFRSRVSAGVALRLTALRPDVLLIHSWDPPMFEPLLWATVTRCPVVIWSESAARTGLLRTRVSNVYRSLFVRRADAIVSIGSSATEYLLQLGASQADILEQPLPSPLAAIIARGPLSKGDFVHRFLFVGRFVDLKRPLLAIRAFLRLADQDPRVRLHAVGEGPLLDQAVLEASRHGDRIRFSTRLEGHDLVSAYLEADVLVLPSGREVWGLVVNEALAAGLFVITSDNVGSGTDLLGPGLGCQFPVDDEDELYLAMRRSLDEDSSQRVRIRRRESVARATAQDFAAVLALAVGRAANKRHSKRYPNE
jgi:glycosyltransferase involved in cell wall biosynthesis